MENPGRASIPYLTNKVRNKETNEYGSNTGSGSDSNLECPDETSIP